MPTSEKRQPMARVRSQLAAIFRTNAGADAPNPHHSQSGWLSGNMPLPSIVVATGASSRSASATRSVPAPAAPRPRYRSGRRPAASRPRARSRSPARKFGAARPFSGSARCVQVHIVAEHVVLRGHLDEHRPGRRGTRDAAGAANGGVEIRAAPSQELRLRHRTRDCLLIDRSCS